MLFAGCSKKSQRRGARTKWSVGVMEYWSIGSRTHHSTTPSLHYSDEAYESFSAACQCFVHDLLGLAHNRVQVSHIFEALRVNLVDVLRARRPGREPPVVGHDLEAADRRAVTWGTSQFISDRRAGETRCRYHLGRQFFQCRFLLRCRRRIDACVVWYAELQRLMDPVAPYNTQSPAGGR